MPPEDLQTAAQAAFPPLEAGRSLRRQEMAPAAQRHSPSKGKSRAQALQVSSFLRQHKREMRSLGISRKCGVSCKHTDSRMSIRREEHFYFG